MREPNSLEWTHSSGRTGASLLGPELSGAGERVERLEDAQKQDDDDDDDDDGDDSWDHSLSSVAGRFLFRSTCAVGAGLKRARHPLRRVREADSFCSERPEPASLLGKFQVPASWVRARRLNGRILPTPLPNPLWRKSPAVLARRFPALFVAISCGASLLALAVAAGPLLVSAAGNAVLKDELNDATRFGAGASIEYAGIPAALHPSAGTSAAEVERVRRLAHAADIQGDGVGAPVLTVLGATVSATRRAGDANGQRLRLLARTGALANVRQIEGREGGGFWIADSAAHALDVGPGDAIYVTFEGATTGGVRLVLDGVYAGLSKEPPSAYWHSLAALIHEGVPAVGPEPDGGLPPTFVIGDPGDIARVTSAVAPSAPVALDLRWEWPLTVTDVTRDEGARLVQRFEALRREAEMWPRSLRVPVRFEGYSSTVRPDVGYSSFLPTSLARAAETASAVRGPADVLSVAGALVAAAVVAATAVFTLARRRTEAALLFARGVAPGSVGARTALEAVLPVILGAGAGYAIALVLVHALSPGGIDRPVLGSTARATLIVVPAALVLLGLVAAIVFSRHGPGAVRRVPLSGFPWELAALALAAVLLAKLLRGGAVVSEGAEIPRPSVSLLVFPIAFILGGAGLGARVLMLVLRGKRATVRVRSHASYLAIRRIAASKTIAILFVTGGAVALGTFVYAQAVVASYSETIHDKSLLSLGSDVRGSIGSERAPPRSFPLPITKVTQLPAAAEVDGTPVDVLAIDSRTFAGAAHWRDRYADEPLEHIVAALGTDESRRLPVALIGGPERASTLTLDGASIPIAVRARPRAFPGSSSADPRVVVDSGMLARAAGIAGIRDPLTSPSAFAELWVRGNSDAASKALLASPARPYPIATAEELRRAPSVTAFTRTFAFLKAIGLAAAVLSVVAAVLYLQTRQRARTLAVAFARRMGLSVRAHRASVALELGALLLSALALGALLALASARLVLTRIEPIASLTPAPLFAPPTRQIATCALVLVAASIIGGWFTSWTSERARVTDVLRLDA